MAAFKVYIIFSICLAICSAFFFDDPDKPHWNELKVKFPFSTDIPLTMKKAIEESYTSNIDYCAPNSTWRGRSMVKPGQHEAIPIYDANGYIAGIQTEIKASGGGAYLGNQKGLFIKNGSHFVLTAYFIDPKRICTGRTESQYEAEGTGTDLYIQNGPNPERDYVKIPRDHADIEMTPGWVEGKCFLGMGIHYWMNLTEDMDCNDFFPVFLLYNGTPLKLTAFGWVFMTEEKGNLYEHPPNYLFGAFMKKVPKCAKDLKITTQHVYLRSRNFC